MSILVASPEGLIRKTRDGVYGELIRCTLGRVSMVRRSKMQYQPRAGNEEAGIEQARCET